MFELSPHIDKNKIFLVNLSEIEGRLDPYYFHNRFKIIDEKLSKKNRIQLKNVSKKIFSGITPKSGGNAYTSKELGIPFIRSGDFSEENTIDFKSVKYIKPEIHNGLMKGSKIKKNDILIAIVGATIGKVGVYKYDREANINQAICAIHLNEKLYLPEFVQIFLLTNIGQLIIDRLKRPVARANINLEEIASIILPKIDIHKQKEIIKYYYSKIKSKQQKEIEAEHLLNSIDDYILGELGITLPEKDNSLKNRIFKVGFSEVTGGRFDPYYYKLDFQIFFDEMKNSIYPIFSIKQLAKKITSGITPLSGGDAYTKDKKNGIPFIRSGNIDINGNINFDDLLYLKEEIHKTLMHSSQVKYNDLLVAIVGATIGQIGIYKDNREANINQAIALIRLKDNNNVDFIKEVLKSSIGQYNLNRLKRPVARANINLEEISTIQLPIPPLEKQNEIAEHIKAIREQAERLKSEAKEVLEQAKLEVEKMILQT